MQELVTWYWLGGKRIMNFGERFVDLIGERLGFRIVPYKKGRKYPVCTLIIGSEFQSVIIDDLLQDCQTLCICGQGNGRGKEVAIDMQKSPYKERIKVFALRGPLTKAVSNIHESVPLLDPGFLLPTVYPLTVKPTGDILYVPHHSNGEQASKRLKQLGATKYKNVFMTKRQFLPFLEELATSRFVLTNSLHTYIACLAYRIPVAASLLPDEDFNMPEKWNDVAQSIGLPFRTVTSYEEGKQWWESVNYSYNPASLLKAFERLKAYVAAAPQPKPGVFSRLRPLKVW